MSYNFTRWIEDYYADYWHSLGGFSTTPYASSWAGSLFSLVSLLLYVVLLARGFFTDRSEWQRAWHAYWMPGFAVEWGLRYVRALSLAFRKAWVLLRPRPEAHSGGLPAVVIVQGKPVFLTELHAALKRLPTDPGAAI